MAQHMSLAELIAERNAENIGPVGGRADLKDALKDAKAERDAWERVARRRLAELVSVQRELEALKRALEGGVIWTPSHVGGSHYDALSQNGNM
jgi:hypothetical protein